MTLLTITGDRGKIDVVAVAISIMTTERIDVPITKKSTNHVVRKRGETSVVFQMIISIDTGTRKSTSLVDSQRVEVILIEVAGTDPRLIKMVMIDPLSGFIMKTGIRQPTKNTTVNKVGATMRVEADTMTTVAGAATGGDTMTIIKVKETEMTDEIATTMIDMNVTNERDMIVATMTVAIVENGPENMTRTTAMRANAAIAEMTVVTVENGHGGIGRTIVMRVNVAIAGTNTQRARKRTKIARTSISTSGATTTLAIPVPIAGLIHAGTMTKTVDEMVEMVRTCTGKERVADLNDPSRGRR